MMTRKYFFFEEDYFAPFARENAGDRAPGGPATHYNDVESVGIHA
jgi:hypothetical protein